MHIYRNTYSFKAMKRVAFGFLGTTLDAYGGYGGKRHSTWRPTVSLGSDKQLGLARLEVWHSPRFEKLAQTVKQDVEMNSPQTQVVLRPEEIRDPWNFEEVYSYLYDFADSYPFKIDEEEYFVHLTTGTHVAQICLFLLTETRHFPAKLVQTSPRGGPSGEGLSVIDLDLSQYDKVASRFKRKLRGDLELLKTGIETRNKYFNTLIAEIERVAKVSSDPMLLLGPTGAGKSHLAKQIFLLKKSQHRISGEFVGINCATLRGEQAMATLFGHAKGAFTGAVSRRDGLLKKAHKGLLFLDEIGELGLDEQAMLLRAVEEKCFFPFGSDEEEHSDFQLIAGTNCDLSDDVRNGSFREDLLHRINLWSFTLPALRERREDIEPNLEFELQKFEQRNGQRVTFRSDAKAAYLTFAVGPDALWPGNFRDLNASVTRMATLAPQGRITSEVVDAEIGRLRSIWQLSRSSAAKEDNGILEAFGLMPDRVEPFDRPQLIYVLETVGQAETIADAGRQLFSLSRLKRSKINDSDRVRKYLARFGIDARRVVGALR